jgi:hypothetical protein
MITNPKKITTRKHYMANDLEITEKIDHLVALYYWSRQEAMEYLLYDEYDPVDWIDSPWEEPCSLPPY